MSQMWSEDEDQFVLKRGRWGDICIKDQGFYICLFQPIKNAHQREEQELRDVSEIILHRLSGELGGGRGLRVSQQQEVNLREQPRGAV